MANLNYLIDVNLATAAPRVSTADFDKILIMSADAVFAGTTLIKTYYSPAAIDADAELTTAALKTFAKSVFTQAQNPGKVMIGEAGVGVSWAADLALLYAYDPSFYYVVAHSRVKAEITSLASGIGALEKVLICQDDDVDIPGNVAANTLKVLTAASYNRVAFFYHETTTAPLDIAVTAHKAALSPDRGATTWAKLHVIGPAASTITDAQRIIIETDKGNVYMPFYGIACTHPGIFVNGDWIDTRISGDWVSARIREGIAQLLLNASSRNEKVPYTDAGIQRIAKIVRQWLARGEALGHFRAGSGQVDVPLLADIPTTDVEARELSLTARATLAGAIDQSVELTIGIYES
jgi:hypothetical protein